MHVPVSWLAVGLFAAGAAAQVGSPMPSIAVEKLYNLDLKIKDLAQLKGSAIFLEYWRTW